MNKNNFALTPPMGWNSYDYFNTTVTEADVIKNADYMAANLKSHGYEYIVVDIEWYAHNVGNALDKFQYTPFSSLEMDEYGRLFPSIDRFPSSKDKAGFKPLADYVHNLGLKFGIHIMRGVPRIAAYNHTPILNSNQTASDIANPSNICEWNPDMYGVRENEPGASAYYNSIFALYASWGVDFVKCDDICRMDMPSARKEIELLYNAIQACGRDIVLSLSPGPALLDEAFTYEKYANMWRITDDLWDEWPLLLAMFKRCEVWQNHVKPGCWPDCDMLPFGELGHGFVNKDWTSRLSYAEKKTMMNLFCLFRSPLMIGAHLVDLDANTLSLLTNDAVLDLTLHSHGARQIMRNDKKAVWISYPDNKTGIYLALFNISDTDDDISITKQELSDMGVTIMGSEGIELWSSEKYSLTDETISHYLSAHDSCLYFIDPANEN